MIEWLSAMADLDSRGIVPAIEFDLRSQYTRFVAMLLYEELSGKVRGAAIEVHKELGPGLLESAYEECLCHELNAMNIPFQRQLELPVSYKGLQLKCGYRVDVLVDNKIILELKCVDTLLPIHDAQLMTYLKLSKCKVGLLLNFNVAVLKDGIKRLVL